VPGVAPDPRPLNEPTAMTYCVLRHSLSRIIGKVTHHFQQLLEPSHYSDVLRLDDELNAFVRSLPPHFAMENPDKTLDNMLVSFLPMHRFYLHTEILFVRITLHVRPSSALSTSNTDPADDSHSLPALGPTAPLAPAQAQVGQVPRLAQRLLRVGQTRLCHPAGDEEDVNG